MSKTGNQFLVCMWMGVSTASYQAKWEVTVFFFFESARVYRLPRLNWIMS